MWAAAKRSVAVKNDSEAEHLVHQLRHSGYQVVASVEQQATGRLATIRLTRGTNSGVVTDLLFASCGIEPEIVAGATVLAVVAKLSVPVASVGHLIAMKLLARDDRRRPLDADDLRALRVVAKETDWTVAEESVQLIHERGFTRGRDLCDSLRALRDAGAY